MKCCKSRKGNTFFVLLPVFLLSIGVSSCLSIFVPLISVEVLRRKYQPYIFVYFFTSFRAGRIISEYLPLLSINYKWCSLKSELGIAIATIGFSTISWGILNNMYHTKTYFHTGILLSLFLGIGQTYMTTYIIEMLEQLYPVKYHRFYGIFEAIGNSVYILTVSVMGYLSEIYGVTVPFFICGSFLLTMGIIVFPFTGRYKDLPIEYFAHPNFYKLFNTWIGFFMGFFGCFSHGFISVILAFNVWNRTENFFDICMLFVVNKTAFFITILPLGIIRKDLKLIVICIETALILKMFSFLVWNLPEIMQKPQKSIRHVYAMMLLAGISDSLMMDGTYLLLKFSAKAIKPLENLNTYKTVIRSSKIFNQCGNICGAVLAGVTIANFKVSDVAVILSLVYGATAFIFQPFIDKVSHITNMTLQAERQYVFLKQRHYFHENNELRKLTSHTIILDDEISLDPTFNIPYNMAE